MTDNAPLVYDQSSVDLRAKYVGELHAVLGTMVNIAAGRMKRVRFIQMNPLALTLIQSGSLAVRPHYDLMIDLSANRAAPTEIGKWYGTPVVLDAFANDEHAIMLFGTGGEVETIEIKNASFL